MTIADAKKLLATLPDDALFCYMGCDDDIVEIAKIDIVRVKPHGMHFHRNEQGEVRVAVVK